ncbi:MAG: ChaN family lipoprotein [Nitrospirae bacterium]|nr:ChaN family lipoprotein [Nitrospirota bacterium]
MKHGFKLLSLAMFAATFMMSGGCAVHSATPTEAEWRLPYPLETTPREDMIMHVRTGKVMDRSALHSMLADARVVYVAESHDNIESHRVQAEIIREMARRYPGHLAVGMEMFPESAQPVLDKWRANGYNDEEFDRIWTEHWSVDLEYYRPVIDVIKQFKLQIIALNASKSTVKEVSSKGIAEASGEVDGGLPEMDLTDKYQRKFLEAMFEDHAKGTGMIDRFVQVQTLWDETMAENIVHWLKSDPSGENRIVVMAGGNHVTYGFGIPRRVFRRLPVTYYTVAPEIFSYEHVPKEKLMDVDVPELPLQPSDFIWYIDYKELELKRVKLGVRMQPNEGGGIKVVEVLPDSMAEAAGIKAGDVLVEMNGQPLREPHNLTYRLKQVKPGDTVRINLVRGGHTGAAVVNFR